jgi:DNA primase
MSSHKRHKQLSYAAERAAIAYPLELLFDLVGIKPANRSSTLTYYVCPFHDEETASLCIVKQKNIFYCYGCQTGGHAVAFLQEMCGWGYRRATVYILTALLGCTFRDIHADDDETVAARIHTRLAGAQQRVRQRQSNPKTMTQGRNALARRALRQRALSVLYPASIPTPATEWDDWDGDPEF